MKHILLWIISVACLYCLGGCASAGNAMMAFGRGYSEGVKTNTQQQDIRCTSTVYGYTVYTECK